MEDKKIVELYLSRGEFAITATKEKYGDLCSRFGTLFRLPSLKISVHMSARGSATCH